jgi:hypothetical protein
MAGPAGTGAAWAVASQDDRDRESEQGGAHTSVVAALASAFPADKGASW